MIKASELRIGNKFKSCFGQVQTVLSIIDNTRKGEIKVYADCPDNVPHFKSEQHRLMYSHLILCEENGNQYKPCEIEGEPLTEEWLFKFGFDSKDYKKGFIGIDCGSTDFVLSYPQTMGEWQKEFCWTFDNYKFITIKYVHELQNLYFLLSHGNELKLTN